jgi:hypothetical protein
MHNNSLFKSLLFLVSILLFLSCDKEYSAVGDALIGENNFELAKYTSNVVAHNEKITPIESINFLTNPINALGIYDNPAFGKTTANFVTQLTLASANPTIDLKLKPVIDSVYIDVPYFVDASQTKSSSTGGNTYVLDSIYGDKAAKIKLSIYESGRYMGNQIGGVAQIFYTNQNSEFDSFKIPYLGNRLNDDSDKSQNDAFFFNPKQNTLITKDDAGKETRTYSPPSMRLKLNSKFFNEKIINAPSGSLATNDVFMNYFRGLYFKVEQSGADKGSLAMINFTKGTITIKYKEDKSATDATRVDKSFVLNMSGNAASLLEQTDTKTDYETTTNNPNRILGDDKLYLKGGEGSLAVIDLFGKGELDKIRKEGWLINNANLVFNIDTNTMKDSFEPERLYLYDFTNSTNILDYFAIPNTNKNLSKYLAGGFITKDATSKRGVSYKMNVTSHIINLIKKADAVNVQLGLVVTEDINNANFNVLKTTNDYFKQAPRASVMNPLGTILYGSNASDESKRPKLEIYYTKPK